MAAAGVEPFRQAEQAHALTASKGWRDPEPVPHLPDGWHNHHGSCGEGAGQGGRLSWHSFETHVQPHND